MKKRLIIGLSALMAAAVAAVVVVLIIMNSGSGGEKANDEGASQKQSEKTWVSKTDKKKHSVALYSFGNTADKLKENLSEDITIEHKFVDDVAIYEVHGNEGKQKILFLLHGQSSRKEEYLHDAISYAEQGYYCVTVDLYACGERILKDAVMSLEITAHTGKDIDLLLDYYESTALADSDSFGIIGFSQGGSVAYWYAANGKRMPKALIVGSTTPDYSYFNDKSCIKDGKEVEPIWSEKQIRDFIAANNPLNHMEKFEKLPIMSGNSVDDNVVSYKGSEDFEKKLCSKNKNLSFYYFDGLKHNVSESFIRNIPAFLKKYLTGEEG